MVVFYFAATVTRFQTRKHRPQVGPPSPSLPLPVTSEGAIGGYGDEPPPYTDIEKQLLLLLETRREAIEIYRTQRDRLMPALAAARARVAESMQS